MVLEIFFFLFPPINSSDLLFYNRPWKSFFSFIEETYCQVTYCEHELCDDIIKLTFIIYMLNNFLSFVVLNYKDVVISEFSEFLHTHIQI